MTDRELMQMALEALQESKPIDIDDPAAFYRSAHAIEALRVALTAPPEELDLPKVRLEEFLKLIEGKEDFRGIPLMRTEWPTREET